MKDRLWQAAYNAFCPLLNKTDVVAAPRGDWPRLPCAVALYDDLIDLKDCTIFVLHKGQLTGLPKGELRQVAENWQWIFANEVFVVLGRSPRVKNDVRHSGDLVHCKPLMRFLASASLRKRHSKIVYVHVPKTGGTSVWASLTRAFPSHAYYTSPRAYLSNPPPEDDYDLIGLHFSPRVLLASLRQDDWIIGMVRNPTRRLISAVMHARRDTEDLEIFTASARAMRQMDLAQYVTTDLGRLEARLQLITFGTHCRQTIDAPSDHEMLCSARAFVRRDNVVLAPSERSPEFMEFVAHRLEFRPAALPRLNANAPAILAANWAEVERAIALINATNVCEREFYDSVCLSFDGLRAAECRRSGRSSLFPIFRSPPRRAAKPHPQPAT
ncbi:MAG: sulfotransferase family 2 domain-containing protein [Alphaproteobacteria bacterium]|nr:sulfotransferase family 2 domain-containing protein [Alphaproteobacteria bacterium]